MGRRLFWAGLLLSMGTLLTAPSHAVIVPAEREWEGGLQLGGAIILGDDADFLTDSMAVSIFVVKRTSPLLAWGLEIGNSAGHNLKGTLADLKGQVSDLDGDGIGDDLNPDTSTKLGYLWLSPILKIGYEDADTGGGLRPFAVFGVGRYFVTTSGGSITYSGTTSTGISLKVTTPPSGPQKGDYWGFNLGGGFTLMVRDNIEFGADLRYHNIIMPYNSGQFLLPAARFSFIFGGGGVKEEAKGN